MDRIRNDRYDERLCSEGGNPATELAHRRGWNAASKHVEALILQWANEARLEVCLDELAQAPALDLRLKHALTGQQ